MEVILVKLFDFVVDDVVGHEIKVLQVVVYMDGNLVSFAQYPYDDCSFDAFPIVGS